jgi:hypothetical protein
MTTKTLSDSHAAISRDTVSTEWLLLPYQFYRLEDRNHPSHRTLLCTAVLEETVRITPSFSRAHPLLLDIMKQCPGDLPKVLSMLSMNLSSKEESLLRGILGILERTQQ